MTDWLDQAACHGMDGTDGRVDFLALYPPAQRSICGRCPVRFRCLDDVREWETGISPELVKFHHTYGGLTGEQRAELQRKRRRRVA